LSTSRVLLCLVLVACGPKANGRGDDGTGGGSDGGGSNGGDVDAPACAQSMTKADQVPLDLFVMLDQSGSMDEATGSGASKWDTTTGALKTFLQQPSLAGVSVGIQYFGVSPNMCSTLTCNSNADCGASACGPCILHACVGAVGGGGGDSCTASDYANPEVEIAPLPGAANPLIASINSHSPTTGTPTSAALQGAVDHARTWATAHPGDAVVTVLATDGNPEECDTDLNHINAIAAGAFNATPSIMTFVIGVGSSLTNLNGIAAAGGTTQAFLVDTNGNANQEFLDAMNAIRKTALGCVYAIPLPPDGNPDYTKVNVQYTPGGGATRTLPKVNDKASCPASGDGWYYDNNAAPTTIILCDTTCGVVQADMTGEVDVQLGCSTVIL
jgi:hypothetical protein